MTEIDKSNSPDQAYTATVIPDPLRAPEDGDEWGLQVIGVKGMDGDAPKLLKNPGTFRGVLLALHVAGSDSHDVDGTAVLVAPGVALCATHVIQPHLKSLMGSEKHSICSGMTNEGLQIWGVCKVTFVGTSDIAILGLELRSKMPANRTFQQVAITTRFPRIGERLQIAGIRAPEASNELVDGHLLRHATTVTILSPGLVTGQYPNGRDRAMLPWPVFELDCPSWGGMSGGPVFDEHGLLIGLLCSSFSDADGRGPSYVSMIWPILSLPFEGGWPSNLWPSPSSLAKLDPRICHIDRRDVLSFSKDALTGEISTGYTSW